MTGPAAAAGLDREGARARDRQHPLRAYRARFAHPDPDLIYLDGNSLGRLPEATRARVRELVDVEWGDRLIRSWGEGWFDAPERLGDRVAPLVGAHPGEVVFADATSVNLFKLAMAALRARRPRATIVTDALNFPSDVYVLAGAADLVGGRVKVVPGAADGVHADEDAIVAAIDHDTALVSLSHVAFKSGYRYDAARITAAAHAHGALVLWDLSHSAGAVPVDLQAWGADLAVGCAYKYLNGGPGAPSFLYVREALQDELVQPIWGWFGQTRPFAFDLAYAPATGIRRFTVGTPPVLSLLAVEPGLDLLLEAGMDAIRAASVALTGYLIELADARLAPLGFRVATPRDPERRGSHVTLAHPDGYRIARALTEAGVIPDFREPDGIRLGIAPLYVGYEDLYEAVERLEALVRRGDHERLSSERAVVT